MDDINRNDNRLFTHEYWNTIEELYREGPQPCEDAISRQAIEDIKAEIKEQDDQTHYPYGVISIRTALQIIDKHISGKEQA